jgi:hypothetical protein
VVGHIVARVDRLGGFRVDRGVVFDRGAVGVLYCS